VPQPKPFIKQMIYEWKNRGQKVAGNCAFKSRFSQGFYERWDFGSKIRATGMSMNKIANAIGLSKSVVVRTVNG
jgi:hypothetical protein